MKYGPSEEYKSHVDFYDRDTRFFGNDVTKFGAHRKLLKVLNRPVHFHRPPFHRRVRRCSA